MGLLDDAIREHLELKRKHGANPEDVARQEQEALGPGQRNEFAQPEGAAPGPPGGGATVSRSPGAPLRCPRSRSKKPRSPRRPRRPSTSFRRASLAFRRS